MFSDSYFASHVLFSCATYVRSPHARELRIYKSARKFTNFLRISQIFEAFFTFFYDFCLVFYDFDTYLPLKIANLPIQKASQTARLSAYKISTKGSAQSTTSPLTTCTSRHLSGHRPHHLPGSVAAVLPPRCSPQQM